VSEAQENNNNDPQQQEQPPIIQDNESDAQDFSEPLSPAEAIIGEPVTAEPEPEAPSSSSPSIIIIPPQLPAPTPAETPSTSNNALIMQIILSEYSKDINRSMYAVVNAGDSIESI
jgi:hypothetical protein